MYFRLDPIKSANIILFYFILSNIIKSVPFKLVFENPGQRFMNIMERVAKVNGISTMRPVSCLYIHFT